MYTLTFFLILPLCLYGSDILIVAPLPIFSHFTVASRLGKELAERGHFLTVISPYPQKIPIQNYSDISVEENLKLVEDLEGPVKKEYNVFSNTIASDLFVFEITKLTLKNLKVQQLLSSGKTFDVVILEYITNEALIGFGYKFNAPVVVFSSIGVNRLTNHLVENVAPSSYVPTVFGSYTPLMDFWQRLGNLLSNTILNLRREIISKKKQERLLNEFISTNVTLDDVIANNVSLILANSHLSVSNPVPTVPAIIEIGGYHINPSKKLPTDLQQFLDKSDNGAVLFVMGALFKAVYLPNSTLEAIVSAFSKIKLNVLWKFEDEALPVSSNVKICRWLPQQDVLAHPNIKAFISHGGLHSLIEAIYYSVPVIGLPLWADQKTNIASAVNHGFAIKISMRSITENSLVAAINEITRNIKYKKAATYRSNLLRDRPMRPIDSMVFWVEHVIRHKGAPHLRSAALNLKWYQREMIDIISFVLAMLMTVITLAYIILKKIYYSAPVKKFGSFYEKKKCD